MGKVLFKLEAIRHHSIQIKYINLDESNSNTSAFKLSQTCS